MSHRSLLIVNLIALLPPLAYAADTFPIMRLMATNGSGYNEFGFSVDVFGTTAIVGARNDGAGSAYLFERSNPTSMDWMQTSKIIPSDGASLDEFGSCVSLSGNIAVVGSPEHGNAGS